MKKLILSLVVCCGICFGDTIYFQDAPKASSRTNPSENPNVILSFHSSISQAKQSVVNISTTKMVKSASAFPFDDPIFEQFFGFKFKAPQTNQKSTSLGSGVIISKDGYIVTNSHVVEGSDEIIVTIQNSSKEYKAKLIGSDNKTDIAIIKIEASNLQSIKFGDSSNLLEGDIVFAIGNPFGVGNSITQGIISALNKDNIGLNQYEDFIQTDASINPGNSGGALVDSRGALVGINSAILSRSGANNGVGFAIPSNMVKEIAQKLIQHGKIVRGYIGIAISNLTNDIKELYSSKTGALIINVEPNSPANKANLQRGDLIIKIDDKAVRNANELKNLIGSLQPDSTVEITFERSNKTQKTKVKLANLEYASNGSYNLKGISLANPSQSLKEKFGIPQDLKGVIITDIKNGSQAQIAGFQAGDMIIQIGAVAIENLDQLKIQIAQNKNKKTMFWINRNGITMGLVLMLDWAKFG